MIKYYGGKKWLQNKIDLYLPKKNITTAIDLFVGGGSIADKLVTIYEKAVINDIDYNLMTFYRQVKENSEQLIELIVSNLKTIDFEKIKTFRYLLTKSENELEIAYLYYCCVYSGYGGKPYASPTRDKFNQLKRRNVKKDIEQVKNTLQKCEIYNVDYTQIIIKDAFYYCDPPYCKVGDNTYYGDKGKNHKSFNHIKFFEFISERAKNNYVMISYEDSEFIRSLYKNWNIITIDKKTINFNPNKKIAETLQTNEVLITNYDPNSINE